MHVSCISRHPSTSTMSSTSTSASTSNSVVPASATAAVVAMDRLIVAARATPPPLNLAAALKQVAEIAGDAITPPPAGASAERLAELAARYEIDAPRSADGSRSISIGHVRRPDAAAAAAAPSTATAADEGLPVRLRSESPVSSERLEYAAAHDGEDADAGGDPVAIHQGGIMFVGARPELPIQLDNWRPRADDLHSSMQLDTDVSARDDARTVLTRFEEANIAHCRAKNRPVDVVDFWHRSKQVYKTLNVYVDALNSFSVVAQRIPSLYIPTDPEVRFVFNSMASASQRVDESSSSPPWDAAERARFLELIKLASTPGEVLKRRGLVDQHMYQQLGRAMDDQTKELNDLSDYRKTHALGLIRDYHKSQDGPKSIVSATVKNTPEVAARFKFLLSDANDTFKVLERKIRINSIGYKNEFIAAGDGTRPPSSHITTLDVFKTVVDYQLIASEAVHMYTELALRHCVYAGTSPMQSLARSRVNVAIALYHRFYMLSEAVAVSNNELVCDRGVSDSDCGYILMDYTRLIYMMVGVMQNVQCLVNVVFQDAPLRKMACDMLVDFREDTEQYGREFNYHTKTLIMWTDDGATSLGKHVERLATRCNKLRVEVMLNYDMIPAHATPSVLARKRPASPHYKGARCEADEREYADAFPGRQVAMIKDVQGVRIVNGNVEMHMFGAERDQPAAAAAAARSSLSQ